MRGWRINGEQHSRNEDEISKRSQMAEGGSSDETWAPRAGEESRADGRTRSLIKPYYHWYYPHDHKNHSSDEAYYVDARGRRIHG